MIFFTFRPRISGLKSSNLSPCPLLYMYLDSTRTLSRPFLLFIVRLLQITKSLWLNLSHWDLKRIFAITFSRVNSHRKSLCPNFLSEYLTRVYVRKFYTPTREWFELKVDLMVRNLRVDTSPGSLCFVRFSKGKWNTEYSFTSRFLLISRFIYRMLNPCRKVILVYIIR